MNRNDLAELLQRGDRKAFPLLLEEAKDMVYNTVLGIVQQVEDAEDITQDVFVTIYEQLDSFRGEANWTTWVYRITLSKALDFEKRKKRQKRGGLLKRVFSLQPAEWPAEFNHPGVQAENKEMAVKLFMAIKQLPEKQRIAFTLQKLESLDVAAIAAVLDCSTMAAESLLKRARQQLRGILGTRDELFNQ